MREKFLKLNSQSSTFGPATKRSAFSFGFATPATSTGDGSFGAPATSTAALFKALGATPASTAPFLFGGPGSGTTAAKPTTGFGNTSFRKKEKKKDRKLQYLILKYRHNVKFCTTPTFGNTAPTFGSTATTFGSAAPTFDSAAPKFDSAAPTFESAAPTFDSAAPTFDTNTVGSGASGSFGQSFGTKTSTEFTGFGNTNGSAPQFGQMKFDIGCQSAEAIQQAADELAEQHQPTLLQLAEQSTRRAATGALLAQLAARPPTSQQVVARREVEDHVEAALSPEEEAALAAPPAPLDNISTPEDFVKLPSEGGCFEQCNYHYACGHQCQLLYHPYDREHVITKCAMKCERVICDLGHICPLKCYVDCKPCEVLVRKTLPCGHEMNTNTVCHRDLEYPQNKCLTKVDVTLPDCEHKAQKDCYQDINEVKCSARCEYQFKCGHVCGLNCHVTDDPNHEKNKCGHPCEYRLECGHECGRFCHVTDDPKHDKHICVKRCRNRLECGHECGRFCHVNDDPNHEKYICEKPCEYQLECGHVCEFDCHVTDDPNHEKHICVKRCEYQFQCGHVCGRNCHVTDDPNHEKYICEKPCEYQLECGHVCEFDCHVTDDPDHEKHICVKRCEYQFQCGHVCGRNCHVTDDPDHEKKKCRQPCEYRLECGHVCGIHCHVTDYPNHEKYICEKPCEHQLECGHVCEFDCHVTDDPDHEKHICVKRCEYRLECGHVCGRNCHVTGDPNHEKHICVKRCRNRLECGHECGRFCHVTDDPNHEKNVCRKPCARAKAGCVADLLGDRGDHQCRKLCYRKCDDCDVQVEKVIPECLHTMKLQCKQSPSHQLCNEKCKRLMSCGHPCMDRCGAACDPTKCTKPSLAEVWSPCGHKIRPPCNLSALVAKGEVLWEQYLQYCSTPCGATLACKHLCAGSCVGCAQGRLHQPCTQQCTQENICGHQCQEPCNQICPPCKMPCEVKCVHSHCKKLCGEPCTPCQEKCRRACVHGACSRRCGEPCDRAPCSEQCARLRPCGHRCRGLCGEPCPDICQLCRPDEFPKDFLGDDYEETAKFIVLQDCGHVLEVDSIDCLMMGEHENIQIRKCPFCRKVIINTNRYRDTVNKMFKDDINPIKLKIYGTQKEIQNKLTELQRKVDRFKGEYVMYTKGYLKPTFIIFLSLLQAQQNVSLLEVEMECMYLNIFEMIVECWKTYETQTPKVTLLKDELMEHIKIILEVLKINPQAKIPIKISEQQQNDVGNEIKRLNVIVQLSKLLHLANSTKDEKVTQQVETTKAVVFSMSVFNEDLALESLKQLLKVIKINAPVTKYERELIVKAIGLKAGHWYKCPNGHFYCIGECGGAMALGRCPEAGCGAAIGGAQHALTAGNSHAPEMDGSRFAAWSEQGNNMANVAHDDII